MNIDVLIHCPMISMPSSLFSSVSILIQRLVLQPVQDTQIVSKANLNQAGLRQNGVNYLGMI